MGTTQHIPAHLIDSKWGLLNQDKISGASHHLLDSMILFGEHSPASSIAAPGNNLSAELYLMYHCTFLFCCTTSARVYLGHSKSLMDFSGQQYVGTLQCGYWPLAAQKRETILSRRN
jgi:hypothetical protein